MTHHTAPRRSPFLASLADASGHTGAVTAVSHLDLLRALFGVNELRLRLAP